MGLAFPGREEPPVVIDNRALDGFLDPLLNVSCAERDCATCGHCARAAAQAVRIEPAYRERCLALGRALLDDLSSGRMWGIAPPAVARREEQTP